MAGGTIDLGLVRGPNQVTGTTSTTLSGILKGGSTGYVEVATPNVDYPTPGVLTSINQAGATCTISPYIETGSYFYLDGTLVRAKVRIVYGDAYVLNTNYVTIPTGALNRQIITFSAAQNVFSTVNNSISSSDNGMICSLTFKFSAAQTNAKSLSLGTFDGFPCRLPTAQTFPAFYWADRTMVGSLKLNVDGTLITDNNFGITAAADTWVIANVVAMF